MKRRVVTRSPPAQTRPMGPRPPAIYDVPPAPRVSLRVCKKGYVYAGQVKIGQLVISRKTIRFLDKCKARGERRGSRFVEVDLDEFAKLELKRCEVDDS